MSTQRKDIHRPSVIDPMEYTMVGFEYIPVDVELGSAWFLMNERQKISAHMDRTGGTYSAHSHGGNCMVCGNANAIYTVLFYHETTNTYVRMGDICAQKTEMAYSNGDFDAFKRRMGDIREAVAGQRKAAATLSDLGLTSAWDLYQSYKAGTQTKSFGYEESTIVDMVGKLIQYGSMSEKQANFMRTLLNQMVNREAIAAARAAERALAAPVPAGKQTIVGTVVSKKYKDMEETAFPGWKITVKHASGWAVYGTCPASLLDAQVGDEVSFNGTVTVSNNDEKFGFFSRPTKGVVVKAINPAPVEEVEEVLC